ncbi:MAG: pyridoxal-phosphate dependent enzyme [Terrimicrobiaceae bacterium]
MALPCGRGSPTATPTRRTATPTRKASARPGLTKNLENIVVDQACRISDHTALTIVYQLLREEGLFLGLSSGVNIAGAVRYAKEGGPGQTIVTILCDSGNKYQSKLFNPEWLAANGLDPTRAIESVLL